MAPLTRCMADDNLVPTTASVEYYGRRAEAGLIISEAIIIRPDAQGYPNVPGLYTQEQVNGWKVVTEKVHANGGKIFAQIWHTGRVAHSYFFASRNNGITDVMAPSAIAIDSTLPRMRELSYQVPIGDGIPTNSPLLICSVHKNSGNTDQPKPFNNSFLCARKS